MAQQLPLSAFAKKDKGVDPASLSIATFAITTNVTLEPKMQAKVSTSASPGPSMEIKSATACRYYLRSGRCRRGDKCLFSHDPTQRPTWPSSTVASARSSSFISSRLSAQATTFEPEPEPGRPDRFNLSASATSFQPTTQAVQGDEHACQEIPSDVQPSPSRTGAPNPNVMRKGVPASVTPNTSPCYICMEVPDVYAQHPNCDHHFCPPCLNQWRQQHTQAKNKMCPVCRTASQFTFVTPQPFTGAARTLALDRFRDRARKTPCKNFEKSLRGPDKRPFCAFGDECMYLHEVQGKEYKFGSGRCRVDRRAKGKRRVMRDAPRSEVSMRAEFRYRIASLNLALSNIRADTEGRAIAHLLGSAQ